MAINIEVEKAGNETSASLLRRFSKRVQGSGIVRKVKGNRYKERRQSKFKVKRKTLNTIDLRKKTERLLRLGKVIAK